jgi:hypothetical protein
VVHNREVETYTIVHNWFGADERELEDEWNLYFGQDKDVGRYRG